MFLLRSGCRGDSPNGIITELGLFDANAMIREGTVLQRCELRRREVKRSRQRDLGGFARRYTSFARLPARAACFMPNMSHYVRRAKERNENHLMPRQRILAANQPHLQVMYSFESELSDRARVNMERSQNIRDAPGPYAVIFDALDAPWSSTTTHKDVAKTTESTQDRQPSVCAV